MASVALHVMERLSDPTMLAHVRETGAWLGSQLQDMADRTGRIRQVRGCGFIWGVDVMNTSAHVVNECLSKGLLVCSAGEHTVRILPPLVATQADLSEGLKILESVL